MKNKIKLILPILIVLIACTKKDDNKKTTNSNGNPAGIAKLVLKYETDSIVLNGSCGWASAGGVKYIGCKDDNNSLRVVDITFNIDELPNSNTTYNIKATDFSDTLKSNVNLNFTEMIGGTFVEWNSNDNSGNITLVIEGKKVTANLVNIKLSAGTDNAVKYNKEGTLNGNIVFYKD